MNLFVFLNVLLTTMFGVPIIDDSYTVTEFEIDIISNCTNTEFEFVFPIHAEQVEFLGRVNGWTCFDYSTEYSRLYPEWGMVVKSDNSRFQGLNHLVNFKVNEDKSLTIHDELTQTEYTNLGWQLDPYVYYHFYYLDNDQPTRNYRYLIPNAEEFYATL